jgi:hypothetical protein
MGLKAGRYSYTRIRAYWGHREVDRLRSFARIKRGLRMASEWLCEVTWYAGPRGDVQKRGATMGKKKGAGFPAPPEDKAWVRTRR